MLRRVHEPAVIFTEFRDTLDALWRALAPHHRVSTIHGGMPAALRQASVDALNTGQADVLVATDTAGEGLNLQHRCRLVVNVELPWNPFRLEQRVGRVDRIGQTRRVHAVHLYQRGTIEDSVLARLERRRRAAGGFGAGHVRWAGEDDIAASALGGSPITMRRDPAVAGETVPRAAAEAARLERQRTCLGERVLAVPSGPLWARPSRRAMSSRRLMFLYEVRHVDVWGRLLAQHATPIRVELREAPRNRRESRLLIARLTEDPRIRGLVDTANNMAAAEVDSEMRWRRSAVVKRLDGVRGALGREQPPLLQAALFDRRAERYATTQREVAGRLEAHCRRRADSLRDRDGALARSLTYLIAVWPSGD